MHIAITSKGLFFFHLTTFTLAHLTLSIEGPHILTVKGDAPPSDETLTEFANYLNLHGPGTGDTLITRLDPNYLLPDHINFTDAHATSGENFLTLITGPVHLALGYDVATGPIGPAWSAPPLPGTRESLITLAFRLAPVDLESLLVATHADCYGPRLWIDKPDSFPSSSAPSPSPPAPSFPSTSSQNR